MMKTKVYSFSTDDAVKYGIDAAIILHNMRYWLDYAKAHGEMENDGYHWMYATASKMTEVFPFWSANKIQKLLKRLEEEGVIIAGSHSKSKFDRTKWYTMADYSSQPNGGMGVSQMAECTFSQTAESLYDQYKDSNKDNNNSLVPSETKRSKYKFSDEDLRLAGWMYGRVKVINPAAKNPNVKAWANTIRLMREIDGRDHRQIGELFDWANKDSFWCSNILSPDKLRKQWDTLSAKRFSNHEGYQAAGGQSADGLSDSRRKMLEARARRDGGSEESGSPMGHHGGSVYEQVGEEEWRDSKQLVDKGGDEPF